MHFHKEISDTQSHQRENKFQQYDLRLQLLFGSVEQVLMNSAALAPLLSLVPMSFLLIQVTTRERKLSSFSNLRRQLRTVLLEQVGFQKRFLQYP